MTDLLEGGQAAVVATQNSGDAGRREASDVNDRRLSAGESSCPRGGRVPGRVVGTRAPGGASGGASHFETARVVTGLWARLGEGRPWAVPLSGEGAPSAGLDPVPAGSRAADGSPGTWVSWAWAHAPSEARRRSRVLRAAPSGRAVRRFGFDLRTPDRTSDKRPLEAAR